jgi:DnaJ-class molecular chaperone
VLSLAESAVCRICRGYGHGFSEAACSACSGTGARPRPEREP